MTNEGQSVERLRDCLRTLKPEARAMLVAELERSLLRGEALAGNEFVLQELRRAICGAASAVARREMVPRRSAQLPRRGSHCSRSRAVM